MRALARPRRLAAMRSIAALVLAGALASCVQYQSAEGVSLSSTPPGAEIFIDGRPSGYVTPALIELDRGDQHVVELWLEGFEVARRLLVPGDEVKDLVYWRDTDRFPIHFPYVDTLPFEDFFMPVKLDGDLEPTRIHVRMRLASE